MKADGANTWAVGPPAFTRLAGHADPENNAGVALADLARHYQISIHPADLKSRHGNRIAFAENKPALFE